MKKISIFILAFLIPSFAMCQWQQLGTAITGTIDNDKLGSTHSIDIDSAGTTIVYGTAFNSNVFTFSGYAKVMDWNGSAWIQRGNTFVGTDSTLEGTGSAVSISANGNTVAISSPWGYNNLGYKCGIVRVFDWNGSAWILRGDRINGEGNINPFFNNDIFGAALELSADGNHLIVGARGNTQQPGVLQYQGHARIYNWNGTDWIQVGQDLDGNSAGLDQDFGYSVSINDDGNRVAIGARKHNAIAQAAGVVCMYEYNGNAWVQIGDTIKGTSVGEYVGAAVQLTRDGNSVAIGSPGTNGNNVGAVKIYDWSGTNWIQRGLSIDAIGISATGQSIDFSADGKIVAVGEPFKNGANGGIRVFQWNGVMWQQIGNTISPAGASSAINSFGTAVRINATGSRIIAGESGYSGSGFNYGRISVHQNLNVVGLDPLIKTNVSVFPNPSFGLFQVTSTEQIEFVQVFDMSGKEVLFKETSSSFLEFDLSQLAEGKYTVKIQTGSGVHICSVLKNH